MLIIYIVLYIISILLSSKEKVTATCSKVFDLILLDIFETTYKLYGNEDKTGAQIINWKFTRTRIKS